MCVVPQRILQTILSAFAVNESAFLSLTNEGVLYEVALIPMGVND